MAVSAITLVSEKELTKVFSHPPAYQLPFLHLSSLTCTTYLFHSSFLSIYMPALFLFLSLSLSLSLSFSVSIPAFSVCRWCQRKWRCTMYVVGRSRCPTWTLTNRVNSLPDPSVRVSPVVIKETRLTSDATDCGSLLKDTIQCHFLSDESLSVSCSRPAAAVPRSCSGTAPVPRFSLHESPAGTRVLPSSPPPT